MPEGKTDAELHHVMDRLGLNRTGGYELSDEEARAKLTAIMSADVSPVIKYDLLRLLEVEVINHNPGRVVEDEVMAAQFVCIEDMRQL